MSDHLTPLAQLLVAEIVSSYVKKNQVAPADMPALINTVYQSLMALGKVPEPTAKDPAVPIRQSVRANYWCAWNAGDGEKCSGVTFTPNMG